MDTWTPEQFNAHVKAKIELIKTRMPETYKAIGARAAAVDAKAHQMVRRGLRGEANCFYAFEGGHVVGTPFSHGYAGASIADAVAAQMVNFGCAHVCMWGGQARTDAAAVAQATALTFQGLANQMHNGAATSSGAQHGAH